VKKQKPDLVIVTWEDAWGASGWVSLDRANADHRPLEVISTGFVVKADKKGVQLTSWFDENGNPSGQSFVPRGMITKIKKVKY
jgi:hypothetical protein